MNLKLLSDEWFVNNAYLFWGSDWFIYLFLAVLGLRYCTGFSLVAASRGHSQVVMRGLLIVVTSVVTPGLWSTGLIVVMLGPSCTTACGVSPDQGLSLRLLHWQVGSLPLSHQGSRNGTFLFSLVSVFFFWSFIFRQFFILKNHTYLKISFQSFLLW